MFLNIKNRSFTIKRKAQISIEAAIAILFVIVFIAVFSNLSNNAVESLEIAKIKEQENTIVLSIDEFLRIQGGLLGNSPDQNIIDYSSSFKIPDLKIASHKLSCRIVVSDSNISIISEYYDQNISSELLTGFLVSDYDIPAVFYCGSTVNCMVASGKLSCS